MLKSLLKLSPLYKYKISGSSMIPVLNPGENILANRLSYLFAKPKIGDIVAIKDPRDGKTLIKRIAKIENGSAKQNKKYFVLGDNKTASTDSRTFGWINKKDIIGKIVYP